ncbi:MAG: YggS family pyridoxal phosphate-dependent enzyme [Bacteroidales bacterium]|nr:YggS family pyridoxal phosphate-dependent enzyme [Bacteroidales bacterium]
MNVARNLEFILKELPSAVKLVAVTKTHPDDVILQAYHAGHRIFGENKVQELVSKHQNLPGDIEWHMIGHLQTNKVKYIVPFVHLIHSVDSIKLLNTIDREAAKNGRVIDCLLQLKIAKEETKYGMDSDDVLAMLCSADYKQCSNVRITGLMGMATFTSDESQIEKEFENLADTFRKIKDSFFKEKTYFCELSMGMSDDYKIAVKAGSTMVRIGSLIFGERKYQ